MLSAAAQSTPRARLALGRASSSTSVAHQARRFRHGSWQVEIDARGCQASVRYKYMATRSSTPAWDAKSVWATWQAATTPSVSGLANNIAYASSHVQNFTSKSKPQTADADQSNSSQTTSQTQPPYNDLNGYKSSTFDDPNAPWELTEEEKSKHYDDLKKYRPTEWNEPDGLPGRTPEEKSKDYDDLHKYGPVKWHEPDGLPDLTPEEKTKFYPDLDKYGPSKFSEPDGLRPLTPEELSKNYDDLDTYSQGFQCKDALLKAQRQREMDGTQRGTPRPAKVDVDGINCAEKYKDLYKYGPVKWNEPDGLQPPTAEELSKNYEDLGHYAQYPNKGPETERIHPEEASKRYSDLSSYKPREFDAANRKYPMHPEEKTKNYKDLYRYQPLLDDEVSMKNDGPDGTMRRAEQLESQAEQRLQHLEDAKSEYESSWDSQTTQARNAECQRGLEGEKDEGVCSMDESFPVDKSAVQDAVRKLSIRQRKAQMSAEKRNQTEDDPYSKEPQGLEVSYREEIGSKSTWPTMVRHYGSEANQDAEESPRKQQQQQQQTVAGCEGGNGSSSSRARDYMVLALDPDTQQVQVAQTRSAVVESRGGVDEDTGPMTPSEALMRLYKPVKFLPHLKPLQEQGYEIVSGQGDVLVFCKVRQAEPGGGAMAYDGSSSEGRTRKRGLGQKMAIGTVAGLGVVFGVAMLAEEISTRKVV